MASVILIRILLVLYICSSWILIVDAMTKKSFTNQDNLRNILFRRKHAQPSIKPDLNSIDHLKASLALTDIERRNVIMPRICYFARVAGTGARQKLCLPYNDNTPR
jgi:hypothetical protein